MRLLEVNYYQGPSHGWLKVHKSIIDFKPTEYSYESARYVFLEEDCDAKAFLDSMKLKGIEVKLIPIDLKSESHIRHFPRCKP